MTLCAQASVLKLVSRISVHHWFVTRGLGAEVAVALPTFVIRTIQIQPGKTNPFKLLLNLMGLS